MSVIDIVFLIPLLWGAYKGFRKGLIVEVFSLIALIGGIFCAVYFPGYAQELIETNFQVEAKWVPILAFIATFAGVVFAVSMLGKLIEKFVEALALGIFNKIGGIAFGILKSLLVLSILVFLFEGLNRKWEIVSEEQKQKSILYEPLSTFSGWLIPIFTDDEWVDGFLDEAKQQTQDKLEEEIIL